MSSEVVECSWWGVQLLNEYGYFLLEQKSVSDLAYWIFVMFPFVLIYAAFSSLRVVVEKAAIIVRFMGRENVLKAFKLGGE